MALEYLRAHCSRIGRPGCCRNSVDSWLPAQFRPSYSAKWRSRQIGARPAKPILPSRSLPELGVRLSFKNCDSDRSRARVLRSRDRSPFQPRRRRIAPLRRHHQVRQRVDQRV